MEKIKNKGKKILGFYLLVVGVLLFLKIIFYESFQLKFALSIFGIFTGLELIIRSLKKNKKNIRLFFPGVMIFFISVFFIIYYGVLIYHNISFYNIWPILGFLPGIGLILYYLVYSKKSVSILIPGIFVTIISIILLFGTLGLFTFSFKAFLIMLIPAILVLTGLYFLFSFQIEEIQEHIEHTDDKDE